MANKRTLGSVPLLFVVKILMYGEKMKKAISFAGAHMGHKASMGGKLTTVSLYPKAAPITVETYGLFRRKQTVRSQTNINFPEKQMSS